MRKRYADVHGGCMIAYDARQLDAPTVNARQHDMSTDDVWHCTGRTAPMRTRSIRDARHSRDEYATARDAYG
ncbi:hypothetical protein RI054_11g58280 [Pseudoscourfieldia marina]